ncbi:MAG: Exopolysaccharide biosynthesis polyprenyl glycosylphosphotransferase [Parcubacteria group bacterium GW2011_GWC1_43_12]|nr:MAG: Exopolysaccharide biosynthesis polyprenyl glycosylphosphotransferase [Parcubacteria group bacterium GW2011_GWC1_43_12]
MKKSDLIFTAALVPLDYLMIILAGLAAYVLRTSELAARWRPVLFGVNLPFEKYFGVIVLIGFFWIVVFSMAGLYSIRRRNNRLWEEIFRVIVAVSAGLVGVVFYIFIRREWFDSRFLVLAIWFLAIFFVSWGRILMRSIQKYLAHNFGFGNHNVVIVGGDGISREIIEEIKHDPSLGYNLAAYMKDLDVAQIKNLVSRKAIDDVILANPDFPREAVLELVDFCEEKHINFKFVPNLFQTLTTNVDFDTLGGVPIIELRRTALDGWGKILKRLIDILGSLFGIVIFLPFMAIVAILIKFDSKGPVVYRNERVGPRGKFNTFKFRSMKMEFCTGGEYDKDGRADQIENELIEKQSGRKGPVFKIVNDPRRTKLGRFLEKSSLDELPQFFNVLAGNMSLVGPRPHMPKEVAKYEKWHKKVFNIKPGITGLAQISGRSRIDFDEEAKLDTYYIENWSLGLDLKILFKTPLVVILGKGNR